MQRTADNHIIITSKAQDEDSDVDVEDDIGDRDADKDCKSFTEYENPPPSTPKEEKRLYGQGTIDQEKNTLCKSDNDEHLHSPSCEDNPTSSPSSHNATPYYRRSVSSPSTANKLSLSAMDTEPQKSPVSPKHKNLQGPKLEYFRVNKQDKHQKRRHHQPTKHQEQESTVDRVATLFPPPPSAQLSGGFSDSPNRHLPLKPRPSPHPTLNPALGPAFNPYSFGLTNHSQFLESKLALMSNYNITIGRFPTLGLTPDPRLCMANPRFLPLMGQSVSATMDAGSSMISSLFPLQLKDHVPFFHQSQTN